MKKQYYIRADGFVGNALCWWMANSNGYTTDIRLAGKYSEEEASRICKNRVSDTAYECSVIDNKVKAQKLIIDCQYIDHSDQHIFQ